MDVNKNSYFKYSKDSMSIKSTKISNVCISIYIFISLITKHRTLRLKIHLTLVIIMNLIDGFH